MVAYESYYPDRELRTEEPDEGCTHAAWEWNVAPEVCEGGVRHFGKLRITNYELRMKRKDAKEAENAEVFIVIVFEPHRR